MQIARPLESIAETQPQLQSDLLRLSPPQRAENFIETPAFEVAPELLTSRRTGAMMGELIGHYRIEQLIGVGGMGEIEP